MGRAHSYLNVESLLTSAGAAETPDEDHNSEFQKV
jgi:hypothetical protein